MDKKKAYIFIVLLFVVGLVLGVVIGKCVKGDKTKCKEEPTAVEKSDKKTYYLELIQDKTKKVVTVDELGNMVYKEDGVEKIKTSLDKEAKALFDEYFEGFAKDEGLLVNEVDNKYYVFVNSDNNYFYKDNKNGKPRTYNGNKDKTYFEDSTIRLVEHIITMIDEKENNKERHADTEGTDYSRDTLFVIDALQQV